MKKYALLFALIFLTSCSNKHVNTSHKKHSDDYSNYDVGSIVYVNAAAPYGGDGSSWDKAFNDLQKGLNVAAQGGAEVWIAGGRYIPQPTASSIENTNGRSASFYIPAGLRIFGSFQAGATDYSEANVQRTPTILDGNIGSPSARIDNSFHVVTVGSGVTLDSLKIINGQANDTGYNSIGGGLVLAPRINEKGGLVVPANASITLNRIVFSKNYANQGGAFATHGFTSATISTTYFSENSAIAGGALVARGTELELDNVHFFANSATEKAGAAWFKGGSRAVLHSPLFTNNTAERAGGGILITTNNKQTTETSVQIDDALFSGNRGGEYGGGVANSGEGIFYITESHMHDNFAENGGDIANVNNAQSTAEHCVFIDGRGNFYGAVHSIDNRAKK